MNLQERIRTHRNKWAGIGQWQDPDLTDCLDFMATEVAEAIDKRLRTSARYTRNTKKQVPTAEEIGTEVFDAIMMGCIALDLLGLDLETIAESKLELMDRKRGLNPAS
ncbi:MAG: hypothetical protein P1P76_00795 [Anaerolineales bacterium]|nr:hypothetical protein [Anaerolineales bacterium]